MAQIDDAVYRFADGEGVQAIAARLRVGRKIVADALVSRGVPRGAV